MAGPPERDAAPGPRQGVVIETPRLTIRLAEPADAETYLEIYADPDVTRWLGGSRAKTAEEQRGRIESRRAMHRDVGFTVWAVAEKDTGDLVGSAGLYPVEGKGPEVEVAYHFRKDRWGRGYATEAARACLDYGFETVGLSEIVGLVVPENVASARVLEKCGMQQVGAARYYDLDLLKYALRR